MPRQLSVCLMIILGCALPGFSQSRTKPRVRVGTGPRIGEIAQCSVGTADFSSAIGSRAWKNKPDPVSSTSGDTYGQNNSCFAGYYQVEATETQGLNVLLEGNWGDNQGNPKPNSSSACNSHRVDLKFFGYDISGWHYLGMLSVSGVWHRLSNACSTVYGTKLIQNSPYSKLRVMSKATESTVVGTVTRKVTGVLDNLQW